MSGVELARIQENLRHLKLYKINDLLEGYLEGSVKNLSHFRVRCLHG